MYCSLVVAAIVADLLLMLSPRFTCYPFGMDTRRYDYMSAYVSNESASAPAPVATVGACWGPAGVLKSYAGLSASVFTAVYLAAFRPDAAAFLACLAAAPALLAAVALPLFNAVPFLQDACAEAPRVAGALLFSAPTLAIVWQPGLCGIGSMPRKCCACVC